MTAYIRTCGGGIQKFLVGFMQILRVVLVASGGFNPLPRGVLFVCGVARAESEKGSSPPGHWCLATITQSLEDTSRTPMYHLVEED